MVYSIQNLLWKLAQAWVLIALLIGTAFAQMPSINLAPEDHPLSTEEIDKRKATEDAYKSALKKSPIRKSPSIRGETYAQINRPHLRLSRDSNEKAPPRSKLARQADNRHSDGAGRGQDPDARRTGQRPGCGGTGPQGRLEGRQGTRR